MYIAINNHEGESMRKVEKLVVNYCGYKEPETGNELTLEILGLENAIKNAELRISMLRQGLHLNKMMQASVAGEKDEQTLKTPETKVE